MIAEGTVLAELAFARPPVGAYTIQAMIAATHASATIASQTNWPLIVAFYDLLLRAEPSPVVALNRAVAIAMRDGPAAGLALIDPLASGELATYRFAHAARADLLRRRRDELVMMPHAIRRVYVARRARTAASLAIALVGTGLLAIAAKPAWAQFLAKGLPGINPAVLCTLIIAMWLVGLFAYFAARAVDEHRFAVAMSKLVMPSKDASVDVAYCTGVFMHLDEWDRFRYVTEAFRVLRAGGRLYIDNFNLLSEEGWTLFESLCRLDPVARPANISKSSTPEELRLYATRAGFANVRVRTGGLWVSVFGEKR